jgi:hypothetical protein
MTITKSTAFQNVGNPPVPVCDQRPPRSPLVRTRKVIHAATAAMTHAPNRSIHLRITTTGQQQANRRGHAEPHVEGIDPEQRAGDPAGHQGHGPELERGPSHELSDVEDGGDIGSTDSQRGTKQDHSRHAFPSAGHSNEGKRNTPDERADDDGQKRLGESECGNEESPRDEDQETDAEVAPQHREVQARQPADFRGDRPDTPSGSLFLEHLLQPSGHRGHPILQWSEAALYVPAPVSGKPPAVTRIGEPWGGTGLHWERKRHSRSR